MTADALSEPRAPGRAPIDWIAVDWGTSRLRAWGVAEDGAVVAERSTADGMKTLAPDAFEPALLAAVGDWIGDRRRILIVACGMVGARGGWAETAYVETPALMRRPQIGAHARARDPRLDVAILAGVRQSDPPDVMRGEETQIAGLLSERPDFEGVVCLPGTHSKWAVLRGGVIERFSTAMTGELFSLFATQSILRTVLADEQTEATGAVETAAFDAAVEEMRRAPERFAAAPFGLRAGVLTGALSRSAASSRLSGLLIGAEFAAMRALAPGGAPLALVGAPALTALYGRAASIYGLAHEAYDGSALARAGIAAAKVAIPRDPLGSEVTRKAARP